jgi:hypothetical protein
MMPKKHKELEMRIAKLEEVHSNARLDDARIFLKFCNVVPKSKSNK